MNRLLGVTAFVGFILSVSVNAAAVAGFDVSSRYPYVWVLHVGIFVVFAPFVLVSRADLGPRPSLTILRSRFPLWALVIAVAVFVYCFVNFAVSLGLSGGGTADVVNREYVLSSHGHVLTRLTEAQYHLHKAAEIREFSGFWLPFYLLPCIYFCFRRRRLYKA